MTTVSWIPEKYNGTPIKVGDTLRLKKHGSDDFEEGRWSVETVGDVRYSEKKAKDRAHNWDRSRKHSDI